MKMYIQNEWTHIFSCDPVITLEINDTRKFDNTNFNVNLAMWKLLLIFIKIT